MLLYNTPNIDDATRIQLMVLELDRINKLLNELSQKLAKFETTQGVQSSRIKELENSQRNGAITFLKKELADFKESTKRKFELLIK